MKVQKLSRLKQMNSLLSLEGVTCHDQHNEYSGSDSGESESDEDGADDGTGFNMVMPTRAGRQRVLTSRMRDFLQSR